MKRQEFEFPFTGQELYEAAERCREHHQRRMDHYTAEYDKAMEEFKTSGVEVKIRPEARGGIHAYASTRTAVPGIGKARTLYDDHSNVEVDIDEELKERIAECDRKMREHHTRRNEFARWMIAFDKQRNSIFTLQIDDMNYFWL